MNATWYNALPAASALDTRRTTSAAASTTSVTPLPLAFETNAGQDNAAVRFKARGLGGTLFFARDEVVLALPIADTSQKSRDHDQKGLNRRPASAQARPHSVVRIRFNGANRSPEVAGLDRLPGVVNYFIGEKQSKWRTNVSTYAGIVYQQLYPGVDLRYDGASGQINTKPRSRI